MLFNKLTTYFRMRVNRSSRTHFGEHGARRRLRPTLEFGRGKGRESSQEKRAMGRRRLRYWY
jgi:hypothetical protein